MTDHAIKEGSGLDELRAFLHRLEERRQQARERARDAKGAIPYLAELERAPHTLERFADGDAEADGYARGSDGRTPFFRGFAACMRRMKSEVNRARLKAEAALSGEHVLGDFLASEAEPGIRRIIDLLDLEASERLEVELEAAEPRDLAFDEARRRISEPPPRRAFFAPATPSDDDAAPAE